MKVIGKKTYIFFLIGLLSMFLLVPDAFADNQATLVFNGQEFQADLYLEGGLSYISTESLNKIPGINEETEGYLPLRAFFESRDGIVGWNAEKREISVSWREKSGDWSADELVVQSNSLMQELNTYKMTGDFTMKMTAPGSSASEISEVPEMALIMEGVFQQEPLAMYIKQTMQLPIEEMELTEEELALLDTGNTTTEMVWKDNVIYQKLPFADQWIVQDLGNMDILNDLTSMMNTTPQQSLDMMREFGIINVFGDDVTIDDKEYYTIKCYVDSETYKKALQEMLGDLDFAELMADVQETPALAEGESEAAAESAAESSAEFQQVFEQLMSTIELDYYVDSYINKETLLTERTFIDMTMKFEIDETLNPEGPVSIEMQMAGEMELYDFGEEIQLPDVSNAITQQEFIEQMMEAAEDTGAAGNTEAN